MMMVKRLSSMLAVLGAVTLMGAACSSSGDDDLTIGAFNFTESQILAELYKGVLTEAGFNVTIQQSTNREVLGPALQAGEVQVVPEYLGTFTEYLNRAANGPDAPALASGDVDQTWQEGSTLAEAVGITLLDPSPAADQNAFAVTRALAEAQGLRTLSDLAAYSQSTPVTLGGPPECPQRPFCQPGLQDTYGIVIGTFVPLDAGGPLTKQALEQGTIDLGLIFSSDGAVSALDLVVLEDDLSLQQVDNVVPAVLSSVVTPEMADALNALSAAMTTDDLIAMNKAVDIDRRTPQQVAQEFLTARNLIG